MCAFTEEEIVHTITIPSNMRTYDAIEARHEILDIFPMGYVG